MTKLELQQVVLKIHQLLTISSLIEEGGGKGVTTGFQKAAAVLVWGEPLSLAQEFKVSEVILNPYYLAPIYKLNKLIKTAHGILHVLQKGAGFITDWQMSHTSMSDF